MKRTRIFLQKVVSIHYLWLVLGIGIFLFFFYFMNQRNALDPDFGWHLRMGRVILSNGIPATDPFSYTMSHYPFVDHEWLTNTILALVFPRLLGLAGLGVVFSLFALSAMAIQTIAVKTKWVLLPFLLSGSALVGFVGIRPQIISWVLFSVLLIVLLNDQLWKRLRWFVPLLLLLWVNLHGSFALGVSVVLVNVVSRGIQTKKLSLGDVTVAVFCIIVTFINPYGSRIWWEIWMQLSDGGLRWSIQEWFPAVFVFNFEFLTIFMLSILMTFRYRRAFSISHLVLYCYLLLLGLSSSRHIPFWLLIAIPITTKGLQSFYQEAIKHPLVKKRFEKAYMFFFCFVIAVVGMHTVAVLINQKTSLLLPYPKQAIQFLKAHPSKGNLFSEYDFGGYLIWQYPEKKVFIDGRMPSWRQKTMLPTESNNAFAEYQIIMSGDPTALTLLPKYHIDTVMISQGVDSESTVAFLQRFVSIRLANKERLKRQLRKLGMKTIYKDTNVIIYRQQ